MNLLLTDADAAAAAGQGTASIISLVVMLVFWFGIMYFLMIRPQKKEQKKGEKRQDARRQQAADQKAESYGGSDEKGRDTGKKEQSKRLDTYPLCAIGKACRQRV